MIFISKKLIHKPSSAPLAPSGRSAFSCERLHSRWSGGFGKSGENIILFPSSSPLFPHNSCWNRLQKWLASNPQLHSVLQEQRRFASAWNQKWPAGHFWRVNGSYHFFISAICRFLNNVSRILAAIIFTTSNSIFLSDASKTKSLICTAISSVSFLFSIFASGGRSFINPIIILYSS